MLVNGRFLTQNVTGVQRFAHEILRAAKLPATLLVPPGTPFHGPGARETGFLKGHAWEQVDLARAAQDQPLLNLCNTAPILHPRQLVVLHDAAVAATPGNFTPAFRAWYGLMIRGYGQRARIGTVSSFSASEITRHFGIPASRIEIIPESGEHILRHAPDYSLHEKLGLAPDGYILAAGSLAPNKNFRRAAEAAARFPGFPLVVVGAANARIFGAGGTPGRAIETGAVTDAQLRALYERAACFLFPSLYEGFGLPPLEAMNCGCPVVVARAASLPEVCGEAAEYCDPLDVGDIARALGRVLENPARREDLRAAGLARSEKWAWEAAGRRLAELAAEI